MNGDSMAVGVGRTTADKVYDVISTIIIILVLLIALYPMYFVVIASISDPAAVSSGKVILLPKGTSLIWYFKIFRDSRIITGYTNSIIYTAVGTAFSTFITIMGAYSLSRKDLVGGKVLMYLYLFTMYFSALPSFLNCSRPRLMVRYIPVPMISTMRGTPQTTPSIASRIFVNASIFFLLLLNKKYLLLSFSAVQ